MDTVQTFLYLESFFTSTIRVIERIGEVKSHVQLILQINICHMHVLFARAKRTTEFAREWDRIDTWRYDNLDR